MDPRREGRAPRADVPIRRIFCSRHNGARRATVSNVHVLVVCARRGTHVVRVVGERLQLAVRHLVAILPLGVVLDGGAAGAGALRESPRAGRRALCERSGNWRRWGDEGGAACDDGSGRGGGDGGAAVSADERAGSGAGSGAHDVHCEGKRCSCVLGRGRSLQLSCLSQQLQLMRPTADDEFLLPRPAAGRLAAGLGSGLKKTGGSR